MEIFIVWNPLCIHIQTYPTYKFITNFTFLQVIFDFLEMPTYSLPFFPFFPFIIYVFSLRYLYLRNSIFQPKKKKKKNKRSNIFISKKR